MKKNKVKNEDEILPLFIYAINTHKFYTKRKPNLC